MQGGTMRQINQLRGLHSNKKKPVHRYGQTNQTSQTIRFLQQQSTQRAKFIISDIAASNRLYGINAATFDLRRHHFSSVHRLCFVAMDQKAEKNHHQQMVVRPHHLVYNLFYCSSCDGRRLMAMVRLPHRCSDNSLFHQHDPPPRPALRHLILKATEPFLSG